jgi:tRNA threonylcarbamoyl adenosine modification protein (Sua5/YciO/YrdC/YwlC family)
MLSNSQIITALNDGAVVVIPTDTVYGLVCKANNPSAVARLYALKHREHKPGTIIAASVDQLVDLGIPRRYLKPIESYWPNPISVVIPVGSRLPELHLGKMSLAMRIPNKPELLELLGQTGPLLTTSANLPGQPPATNVNEAKQYFGDVVDLYNDGGDLRDHKPSTIIRVVDDAVEVLRPGAVQINEAGEISEL